MLAWDGAFTLKYACCPPHARICPSTKAAENACIFHANTRVDPSIAFIHTSMDAAAMHVCVCSPPIGLRHFADE
jgi:hypothetical protein